MVRVGLFKVKKVRVVPNYLALGILKRTGDLGILAIILQWQTVDLGAHENLRRRVDREWLIIKGIL